MLWDSWFKRRRWEKRMDAEFRFHLDNQIGDYISQGLSREEAESRARSEFGAVELAKDECRDERPVQWLDQFSRDVRYAFRSLRKSPAFTAAAILTLALGIGANTAIFSAVYAALLKPLPYFQPNDIYSVRVVLPERREQFPSLPVRIQDYLEWRKANTAFSAIADLTPAEWSLTGDGEPERLGGARVSTNFFSFLGVPMGHGRGFAPDEEQTGKDRVVVISDALWRRRYASDPALIGKSINLNGEAHLVVGIAPSSLLVPTGVLLHPMLSFPPRIDIWKPLAPTPSELQGESWDQGLLVRLKRGESAERGRQQFQAMLNRSIRAEVPDLKTDLITELVSIRDIYSGNIRLRLLLVFGASGILLLIACTNIANLILGRVASRASELATRIALGAGRSRIVSQMLTESTLLAVLGGAMGAIVAGYGTSLLAVYGPGDLQLLTGKHVNPIVLLFAVAISLVTGAVCGLIPAWRAYRQDSAMSLREGARMSFGGGRATRFRRILVAVEMALGTALLASAGLLLHSFLAVMQSDRGYQVERVLAADLVPSGRRYSNGQIQAAFYRELMGNLRALHGILAVGAISDLPADGGTSGTVQTIFYPSDTKFQSVVLQRPTGLIRSVTPGYFAASGYAIKAGRFMTDQDRAPVAVISESLARQLWPAEGPANVVGRTFREGDVTGPLIAVVGIVEDVRPAALDQELPPQIYRPYHQRPTERTTVVLKTSEEPAALAAAVRSEIRKMDPNVPIPSMRTMREIVSASVAQRRFQVGLTSLFALLALLLGAVGVYGVVSYSVACRTRDIGLRIALGARRVDVMRWVFSDGMRPVLAGLVAGMAGAVIIAQALRSLLFGIAPTDPLSLGGVALVLLLTSGLACFVPARRAAQLDPIAALRHE